MKLFPLVLAFMCGVVTTGSSAADTMAQRGNKGQGMGDHGMGMKGMMMQNPHHMLVMAYKNNLVTFAKLLQQEVQKTGSVDKQLAEQAVAEMHRSQEQMKAQHDEAMKAMPEEMQQQMGTKGQMMESRLTALKQQIDAIDGEVKGENPDSKKLLMELDQLIKQCEMMPMGGGMKMM